MSVPSRVGNRQITSLSRRRPERRLLWLQEVHTLQAGEIEVGGKLPRNELAHEFLDHSRVGKQPVIQRVRVGHE